MLTASAIPNRFSPPAGQRHTLPQCTVLLTLLFLASCDGGGKSTQPIPAGTVLITAQLSGNATDPDGFVVSFGEDTHRLSPDATWRLESVPPGEYSIALDDVEQHCVAGPVPAVQVEAGVTAVATLPVECYGDLVYREWHAPFDGQLYYLDATGVSRELTPPLSAGVWMPQWSPDGTRVLFERAREDDHDIHVVDLDGTLTPIAARAGDRELDAAWSPDGAWIVYVRIEGMGDLADRSDLRLVGADGSGDRSLLNDGGFVRSPVWSPDGRYIAFGCWRAQHGICYIQPDGTLVGQAPALLLNPQALAWSPDGSRISVEAIVDGHQTVQVLDVATGEAAAAIPGSRSFGQSAWSPDGSMLTVSVTEGDRFPLYVVGADGTDSRLVAQDVRWWGTWSPDGALITLGLQPSTIHISYAGPSNRPLFTSAATVIGGAWRPAPEPDAGQNSARIARSSERPGLRFEAVVPAAEGSACRVRLAPRAIDGLSASCGGRD